MYQLLDKMVLYVKFYLTPGVDAASARANAAVVRFLLQHFLSHRQTLRSIYSLTDIPAAAFSLALADVYTAVMSPYFSLILPIARLMEHHFTGSRLSLREKMQRKVCRFLTFCCGRSVSSGKMLRKLCLFDTKFCGWFERKFCGLSLAREKVLR